MLKIYKNVKGLPSLILMGILLFSGIFVSSCADKEDEITEVILHSFGPSGVNHGEQIKFIGLNLDKVTAIVLPGGVEIGRSQFVTQSSALIELVVPQEAVAGKVTLKAPNGDIVSKSMLSFNVPVVINSVTAEARPGANITITGEMVNWIEEVIFSDDLVVTEFVSASLTELVVTVPMEAETGFLIFKNGGTKPLSFASDEELIVTLPVVTSFSSPSLRHTEKLTITGTDLDLVTSIVFGGDKEVSAFESQSETSIVVSVPAGAVKGKLTLKQASPIDVVTAEEFVIVLPKGSEVTPKPAVPGTDDITITGTDLDLIAKLTLSGVADPILASAFKSQTATEIVLALPDGAKSGGIAYTTIHDYSNSLGVNVTIPGAGPSPLPISLYDETVAPGGGDWSWGKVISDMASTEQAFSGNVSWKFETDDGGGLSAGGITAIDASEMVVFAFSLYGGPGTTGKDVAVILNDNWGNYNTVKLVAGEWTSYEIPLTSYPAIDLTQIVRFTFKVEGMAASTIFADRVGFDMGGPAPLDYYIYDDALQNGWGEWDGWGHSGKDFANEEEVFHGSKAIKVTYNDQWGAIQFGSPSADVFSGYTTLSFRVYAPEAQDLIVQLNNDGDFYLSIPSGWSQVEVPIADIAGNDNVGELRFKNNNANLPVTLYFDEIGLKN